MGSNNPPPEPIRTPHARTSLTSCFMAFLVGFYGLVANVMNTSQSFSYYTSAFLFGLSILGFWLCVGLIPGVGGICATKGLYGRDINKAKIHYMLVFFYFAFFLFLCLSHSLFIFQS